MSNRAMQASTRLVRQSESLTGIRHRRIKKTDDADHLFSGQKLLRVVCFRPASILKIGVPDRAVLEVVPRQDYLASGGESSKFIDRLPGLGGDLEFIGIPTVGLIRQRIMP